VVPCVAPVRDVAHGAGPEPPCCKLRHPSDLTEAAWAPVEALIPSARRSGGRPRVGMREEVNGAIYALSTGWQ